MIAWGTHILSSPIQPQFFVWKAKNKLVHFIYKCLQDNHDAGEASCITSEDNRLAREAQENPYRQLLSFAAASLHLLLEMPFSFIQMIVQAFFVSSLSFISCTFKW